jgi:hypothetical protein
VKTHYDVLGVSPESDREALRRAYVDLARRHHPDAGGDAAAMLAVNDAWAVLSDPGRRARYDWTIGASSAPPAGAPTAAAGAPEPDAMSSDGMASEGIDLDPRSYGGRSATSSLVDTLSLLVVMVLGLLAAVTLLMGMMLTMGELLGLGVFLAFLTVVAVLARMLLAMRSSRS